MIIPGRLEEIVRGSIIQMMPSVMQSGNAASTVTLGFSIKPRENQTAFYHRAHLVLILSEADACVTAVLSSHVSKQSQGLILGNIAE